MEGYVVAATLQYFGMRSIDSENPLDIVTTLQNCTNVKERQTKFQTEMVKVLEQTWNLPVRPKKKPAHTDDPQDEDASALSFIPVPLP